MAKHNDVADLEKQLQRAAALIEKQKAGGILVITEGVFGMAGDQGKLKEILALKGKYDFRILVDDAHGFGTLGATGAGAGARNSVGTTVVGGMIASTFLSVIFIPLLYVVIRTMAPGRKAPEAGDSVEGANHVEA